MSREVGGANLGAGSHDTVAPSALKDCVIAAHKLFKFTVDAAVKLPSSLGFEIKLPLAVISRS